MSLNKKLSMEISGNLFDYKLFDTLKAIDKTKSQRKAAKELCISHPVLNRRILKAEELLSEKLVIVSSTGTNLTEYALNILEEYETYENRLSDSTDSITVAGGPISCEFIRQLAQAYQMDNLKIIETDKQTAFDLANKGLIDILGFDDPVQAYIYDIEPTPLGRDNLVLLSHDEVELNSISDLNGLKFVEVEGSAQRLAWTTLANYDLDFDIVYVVNSYHEAIRLVEQNENLYTFINNSMAYTSQHTSNIISKETRHIISALNVKNNSFIESFLNIASHRAQKVTVNYGFEHL
ncbi:LysR family transcriptional regulator [Methanosphaera sp.]